MIATRAVEVGCQQISSAGSELAARAVGSCLVVSVWDRARREGGLAHLPLPRQPDPDAPPERFVDSGLERLLERLGARGSRLENIEVHAVGAAELLRRPGEPGVRTRLASRNLAALEVTLERLGLGLAGADVGGDRARNVLFEIETGTLRVTTL